MKPYLVTWTEEREATVFAIDEEDAITTAKSMGGQIVEKHGYKVGELI